MASAVALCEPWAATSICCIAGTALGMATGTALKAPAPAATVAPDTVDGVTAVGLAITTGGGAPCCRTTPCWFPALSSLWSCLRRFGDALTQARMHIQQKKHQKRPKRVPTIVLITLLVCSLMELCAPGCLEGSTFTDSLLSWQLFTSHCWSQLSVHDTAKSEAPRPHPLTQQFVLPSESSSQDQSQEATPTAQG